MVYVKICFNLPRVLFFLFVINSEELKAGNDDCAVETNISHENVRRTGRDEKSKMGAALCTATVVTQQHINKRSNPRYTWMGR